MVALSTYKDQLRGALMFSLICVWINDWVNNREAGDLRRYRAHYDVIVMIIYHIHGWNRGNYNIYPQQVFNVIAHQKTKLKTVVTIFTLLTHWGRMTHICVRRLTIIGSDNGLSPDRRQAIIWTNAGILLIGPSGTNLSEILIKILTFSFKKMRLKLSSAKRWPFCLGLNVLNITTTHHSTSLKWLLSLSGSFLTLI